MGAYGGSEYFLYIDFCPWLSLLFFSLEASDGSALLPEFHTWPAEGRSTAPMFPSQQVGSTSSKKSPVGLRHKGELTECYWCCLLRSQNPADCTGLLRKQCQVELWKPWFSAKTLTGIKIRENKPLEGSGISDNTQAVFCWARRQSMELKDSGHSVYLSKAHLEILA